MLLATPSQNLHVSILITNSRSHYITTMGAGAFSQEVGQAQLCTIEKHIRRNCLDEPGLLSAPVNKSRSLYNTLFFSHSGSLSLSVSCSLSLSLCLSFSLSISVSVFISRSLSLFDLLFLLFFCFCLPLKRILLCIFFCTFLSQP